METDLNSILDAESSATADTTAEQAASVIAENSSNAQAPNAPGENASTPATTESIQQSIEGQDDEKMTMTDTTYMYTNQTATVSAGSTEYKKLKMEKLSRIRDDVKKKSITVKQAKEQLKYEQLEYVDEIESEEDAVYAAKPSKEKGVLQAQELPYMRKVNGSVIIRLG